MFRILLWQTLTICGGPMVDAAARRALSNITERMFRDIWGTRAQWPVKLGYPRYILRMLQLLLTEAIRHAHYAVTPLRYTWSTGILMSVVHGKEWTADAKPAGLKGGQIPNKYVPPGLQTKTSFFGFGANRKKAPGTNKKTPSYRSSTVFTWLHFAASRVAE